ncbi:MAG: endonuclease III [Planctomycetia bacterium]|nr:endonuclease III [Planctomycetia bacterium]
MELAERAAKITAALKKAYPEAKCSLEHEEPLQLLIATILSAQCTDERVNKVTPGLFRKYRGARAFAESRPGELEADIRSTGFFNNKAKSIRGACRVILEKHGGKVPETMEGLLELPGVARKTANVVLGNAFGRNEGVVVDTHVQRLSRRMGLTRQKTPEKIERALMKLVPREDWALFSHLLIHHGRAVCDARKPECGACGVEKWCPRVGVGGGQ